MTKDIIERLERRMPATQDMDSTNMCEDMEDAIALIASQARRIEELEEGLIGTTASLVAAVSLLERGGKRAAPSDKMFTTMLADYNASIERARSLLSRKGGE